MSIPSSLQDVKVLFVTNVLSHYRKPLFELMATRWDVHFLFYSDGREWYWKGGSLPIENLPAKQLGGFWLGSTRISPPLVSELFRSDFDVLVQGAIGKFALPAGLTVARLRRRPVVLWTGVWQRPDSFAHRLTRRIYENADAIVTYGKHVSRFVASEGADPAGVFEAPQAIEHERFSTQRHDGEIQEHREAAHGRPVILYVGRLEPWKGPQILMEALALLARRGCQFLGYFVGDGSLKEGLERRARNSDLEGRVLFPGSIPNEELPATYQSANLVVIPSIDDPHFLEPWSLVVNEAMAARVLVIASDAVGAVRDGLVEHGKTGFVFRQSDVSDLADQLESAIGDPAARDELVEAACKRIQGYNYQAAVEGFEKAIRHALAPVRSL